MTDQALEYPYNIFPRNELRRVLARFPIPLPVEEREQARQDTIESIRANRHDEFKGEPIDVPHIATSTTLRELKGGLDADSAAFVGARTQFTGHPQIGPTVGENYTVLQIAAALTELIDLGYAEENSDGSFSMTTKGHEALRS